MSARILLPSSYVDYRSSKFLSENLESISNHLDQVRLIREEHGLEAALIEVSNVNGRVAASALSFSSSFNLNALYHVTGSVQYLNAMEDDLDLNNLRNLFTRYISGRESSLPTTLYVSIVQIKGKHYFKYIAPISTQIMLTAGSGFDEVPEFVSDCSILSPFDSLGLDISFATGAPYEPVGFCDYDGKMDESCLAVLSFTLALVSTYNKLLLNYKCSDCDPSWSTLYLNEILWFATQSAQHLVDTLRIKGFKLHLCENSNGTLYITSKPKTVEVFDVFALAVGG